MQNHGGAQPGSFDVDQRARNTARFEESAPAPALARIVESLSARDRAVPAGHLALLSFNRFDPRVLDSSGLFNERPRHLQLGGGPLEGYADQLYFNSCAIRFGHFTQTVQVEVQFPADRITIGTVLEAAEPVRVNGKEFAASHVTAFHGREATDVVFTRGTKWVTFNLPASVYAAELAAEDFDERLDEPRNAPRLQALSSATASLRRALTAVRTLAYDQPYLFSDPQWRANSERSLTNGFVRLLDGAPLRDGGRQEYRLRSAGAIVREVKARLDEQEISIPHVTKLCRDMRMSRRTLERAFHETLNMSPATYFRIRALNAVRRQLLGAPHAPGIVARMAIEHGFWHLGRFAASYRALFAERPVDTLRLGTRTARLR